MQPHPGKHHQAKPTGPRFSVWLFVGASLLLVGILGAWALLNRAPRSTPPETRLTSGDPAEVVTQPTADNAAPQDSPDQAAPPGSNSREKGPAASIVTTAPSQPLAPPASPVDPVMNGFVTGLQQLTGTNVNLTAEAMSAWRTNFAQLVQAGPEAVPALRAFLAQNSDQQFSQEAWQALGYGSTRLAALDALRQIGGPDANAVMQELLGSTQSPNEIAVLAFNLEQLNPGQYREQALSAARTALQTAAGPGRNPEVDFAPLFEVFQKYGDASVIPDLENAMGQWKYYAAMALVNLPENAGIPSLLRMADPSSGSGNRLIALETVAQLAAENPAVQNFLLQQAQAGHIPARYWPYLTGPLSGDQYYPVNSAITQYPELKSLSDLKTTRIPYGNQNLYMLPGNQTLTPDGINQRLAVVDALLKSVADPAAQQALQQARNTLAQRSTRVVHTSDTVGNP